MKSQVRSAFTLIEILIVVVIMAILAATIIPQFTDSTADAEEATAEFNLNTLRAQIELYKAQHGGNLPAFAGGAITGLTTQTTHGGSSFGPYLVKMPTDTITNSATVTEVTGSRRNCRWQRDGDRRMAVPLGHGRNPHRPPLSLDEVVEPALLKNRTALFRTPRKRAVRCALAVSYEIDW